MAKLIINEKKELGVIQKEIYGHFAEQRKIFKKITEPKASPSTRYVSFY